MGDTALDATGVTPSKVQKPPWEAIPDAGSPGRTMSEPFSRMRRRRSKFQATIYRNTQNWLSRNATIDI